jgi:hypothetical protein
VNSSGQRTTPGGGRNLKYFGISYFGACNEIISTEVVAARAVRLRLFEDPERRTPAYSTVRWRTTVVIRLKGGCNVGQQISAQYAVNTVNIRGHVIAHDVLDMPRGPLTLPNRHVDQTAHMKRPDPAFRLQAILASHFSPPKATSRAYRYISDASRVFWD